MTRRRIAPVVASALLCAVIVAGLPSAAGPGLAGASTQAGTVVGEGGTVLLPVMTKLLHDDGAGLAPDFGSYTNVSLDQGIADFVGTGSGQFGADYVVSERPFTAAEAATAAKDGRSFAYVPLAAVPVAIVTLVPIAGFNSQTIEPSDFCQHIPLDLTQMAEIFGFDQADPLTQWSDSRLTCSGPGTTTDTVYVQRWANDDPTMENESLMTYLDSTTQSQALFEAGLTNAKDQNQAVTTDTTPSEHWPYSQNTVPDGDQSLIGKLIDINPRTNAPSNVAASYPALGAIAPVSATWTGAPLGAAWDLPTAAIENAEGASVTPTTASAQAAENDATLAATASPTTNNLVTFNASATDSAAYNNLLMEESYLVVPTNGLPADKATALAQFIRFAVGSSGQKDIAAFDAAPPTTAMVAADLKVAQQLDAEAAQDTTTSTSSTTTTTTAGATTTTVSSGSTGGDSSGSSGGGSGDTGSSGTSGGLAFTGNNPLPLSVLGALLVSVGWLGRRRWRMRAARR